MKGTEKQIKWAKDILKNVTKVYGNAKNNFIADKKEKWEINHKGFRTRHEKTMLYVEQILLNNNSAEFYINNFGTFTNDIDTLAVIVSNVAQEAAEKEGLNTLFPNRIKTYYK